MTARFTETTFTVDGDSPHFQHTGQTVKVGRYIDNRYFIITAKDGWEGQALPHELSECSPELNLLLAKLRILGDAS